jgi:ankyrin repeat protein
MSIWGAAEAGDVVEVERLVGRDPGLLDAKNRGGWTPLLCASVWGHVGVVRWMLDKGAATDHQSDFGETALWLASGYGCTPVVRELLERGADPTIADAGGGTPLIIACSRGHLAVVRVLLGQASVKGTIDHRDEIGQTALWRACHRGHGGIVRVLLDSGADPTIADNDGTTPMAIAKQDPPPHRGDIPAEGRRECVEALEVRWSPFAFSFLSPTCSPADYLISVLVVAGRRRSGPACSSASRAAG